MRASASRSSPTLASTRAVAARPPRVAVRARGGAPLSTFAASADVEVADPAAVAAANDAAAEQGLVVRAIKEAKKNGEATKEQVDAEVAKLLELKKLAADLENPTQEATPDAKKQGEAQREGGGAKPTQDVGVTPKSGGFRALVLGRDPRVRARRSRPRAARW